MRYLRVSSNFCPNILVAKIKGIEKRQIKKMKIKSVYGLKYLLL